ncbi:solute carrier organic anion transporter family member 1C1 isoform X2 [Fundulus heteroclitus]|uniref:solute carrier organic anion transporter family member 1C1 isoform X2 n=1 Tax=Fundulus heteroclitus TaxID=8078 RepID=UPI00165B64B2|nr:solute carrier organic anion transporter family member 1C1 isoform X2 [Fundulus heteroclitus]
MSKMDKKGAGSWMLEDSPATHAVKNCHPNLKMFLAALSYAYFAKALSGSYMKSTITQLERRFDIPSYLIGVIDGSFEMGNLLVIAFVSYFGAKLHRPKIIAIGCTLMSLGTFLIAMPHFIIGRYKIETTIRASENSTSQFSPCPVSSLDSSRVGDRPSPLLSKGCEKESSISMWMYVLLGNVLRGIGETPVQPLGISYLDDYAQSENAALYIGCVQTISIIGPIFGFLLGSLCAKIYVDVGYIDMEAVTITPEDARWVGAWWLGYLIAGIVTLLSAVPFWFLPKSLPMPVDKHDSSCTPEQTRFIKDADSPTLDHKIRPEEPASLHVMANEFVPTLKTLLGNHVYILYLGVTIIQFNSLIGMVTYKPKYIEQHYGQSASKANFLMGMINIPAVALGMFSGGVVMKKYKLGVMGAAKFAYGTSLLGFFLSFLFLAMGCENSKVAGITVSYTGGEDLSYQEQSLFSDCNSGCLCSTKEWDPVCGENGITYVSPCLAGCTSSTGSGRNMVFDHCRCVAVQPGNLTARLGQCLPRHSCDRVFPYFLALSVITSFIISLGGTPGFMLLVRCIKPELKSLALGIHTLATRTLAGIPAPIYFGAIIDTTCLKWAYSTCGGRGACRIYNTSSYRRHLKREEKEALGDENSELESLRKDENSFVPREPFVLSLDCNPERETRL